MHASPRPLLLLLPNQQISKQRTRMLSPRVQGMGSVHFQLHYKRQGESTWASTPHSPAATISVEGLAAGTKYVFRCSRGVCVCVCACTPALRSVRRLSNPLTRRHHNNGPYNLPPPPPPNPVPPQVARWL